VHRARKRYKEDRLKRDYINKRREYRILCERKLVEWKGREEEEIEKIKTEAQAWKFIKKGRKRKVGVSKEIKVDEWVRHFMVTLGGVEGKIEGRGEGFRRERDEMGELTEEEMRRELKKLKMGKAAGADGIKNEAWLNGGGKIRLKLGEVISGVWRGDGFPDSWRVGVVVPIWKRGDRNVVENYRGVTLTSTAYKIYANIVNERIIKELDENEGWSRSQAGFRRGRGTIENVKVLKYLVGKRIGRGKKVWAFFLDLKAAFNRLDGEVLWQMMRKRGINEGLIGRVRQIYAETRCRVRIGEVVSREFWVEKGVRQGCPLSPTLFNIYNILRIWKKN